MPLYSWQYVYNIIASYQNLSHIHTYAYACYLISLYGVCNGMVYVMN